MLTSSSTPQAESLIRNTNARVTKTRVKVLDFLMAQSRSLTHHEIQQALSQDSDITKCANVTCFNEVKLPPPVLLPEGFSGGEVDYLIKGLCPRCK